MLLLLLLVDDETSPLPVAAAEKSGEVDAVTGIVILADAAAG